MFELLSSLASFSFIWRAMTVGLAVSLCAALLGVVLVLKRFSLIGDGLSHVGFGAMAIALALNWTPLYVAVPVMIAAAFLLLRLKENSRINSDGAIAVISSSAIAVGITASSMAGGLNSDVYSYMFGSILAVSKLDVVLSLVLCALILPVFIFGYNRIFAVTFDQEFAAATGNRTGYFHILFSLLTAATIVVGMRVMGALLFSGLLVFPAITGRYLFRSFKGVTLCAAVTGILAFLLGMLFSILLRTIPAGAGVILVNLVFLLIAMLIGRIKK